MNHPTLPHPDPNHADPFGPSELDNQPGQGSNDEVVRNFHATMTRPENQPSVREGFCQVWRVADEATWNHALSQCLALTGT
jgi:hypothetical protein